MLERFIFENCSPFKMSCTSFSHEKENTTQSPQHFKTICIGCLWNQESDSSCACLCTRVFMGLLRYISPRCASDAHLTYIHTRIAYIETAGQIRKYFTYYDRRTSKMRDWRLLHNLVSLQLVFNLVNIWNWCLREKVGCSPNYSVLLLCI